MNRTTQANVIIHSHSAASAMVAGTAATVPLFGPIVGDMVGITAITVSMCNSLAHLFEQHLEAEALWRFAAVVAGWVFGWTVLKTVIGLAPGAGRVASAAITLSLQEATGWGIYSVFERGGDPTKLSKPHLNAAIAAGKLRAQTEKANYDRAVGQLTPEDSDEVEQLQKILADRSASEPDKREATDRIVAIFAMHS